jgi:hypothetical protein
MIDRAKKLKARFYEMASGHRRILNSPENGERR